MAEEQKGNLNFWVIFCLTFLLVFILFYFFYYHLSYKPLVRGPFLIIHRACLQSNLDLTALQVKNPQFPLFFFLKQTD